MSPSTSAPLPPAVRRLIASVGISRFGVGLTLPFTLILLHEVRHISLPTVGFLLAVPGVIGLLAVPVGGALIDTIGARSTLRLALGLQAGGLVGLAFAPSPLTALPALALLGAGLSPSFSASSSLLNGLIEDPDQTARAFGMQFTVLNATVGLGSVVGALIVDVRSPGTFEVLYLGNALTCVLQALMLPEGRAVEQSADDELPSYREVWSDPAMRRVCGISLLLALTGYAALDSGLPAYARVVGHVSPSVIALVLTVNTVVIVGGQIPVLRLLKGHRRTSALAAAASLWAVSWALLDFVPGLTSTQRVVAVLVFGGVFGIGEVFMAPSLQPLVNALASDRLRGRYNAASGACFSLAFVVSPALSGVMIGNGLGEAWLSALVLGSLVTATVAVRLARRLSAAQQGLAATAPSRG
ncbi:MAG: major facilitator superfamily 1 [Frankiales bacterium]|nr:major facilitator superfamily 1 [Frankiales bacterium]